MASEVYFTTNPADYQRLEGLYVTERKPPGFIQGRDLSVVGFAGRCVRGPLTPQVITNPQQFVDLYGERDYGGGGALIGEVWAALLNKEFNKVVVRRVAAAAAVKATLTLSSMIRVDATSVGVFGNGITAAIEAASDADATHYNLRIAYLGREWLYKNLNTQAGQDNLATVIGDAPSNVVVVTKLLDGRPTTAAAAALTTGAEGTLAATDYITGLTDLANFQGVAVCLVPELSVVQATLNAAIVTLASTVKDRIFLTWSGSTSNSVATEATAAGTQLTTRSDRIIWCYNAPKTLDPVTGVKMFQAPHVWMASILANTDVDIHPGAHDTAGLLAGIAELQNEALSRSDLIALRDAGISTLEKLPGEFLFRSAVTTNLTPGLTEITRRRMADFLQLSASDRLKYFVKAKNTRIVRAVEAGELIAFSAQLQRDGRIIDEDTEDNGPGFVVNQTSVNTTSQRGQGIEKILWRVRLIGHQLYLVLETEIGTGLVIEAE